MSLLGTGQSGQKLNETEGSAEGAQATGHGKHTWEHEGAMKMSGRHQGGLEKKKKIGVSSKHGDRLVRSCRNYHFLLREETKARRVEMEAGAKRREQAIR